MEKKFFPNNLKPSPQSNKFTVTQLSFLSIWVLRKSSCSSVTNTKQSSSAFTTWFTVQQEVIQQVPPAAAAATVLMVLINRTQQSSVLFARALQYSLCKFRATQQVLLWLVCVFWLIVTRKSSLPHLNCSNPQTRNRYPTSIPCPIPGLPFWRHEDLLLVQLLQVPLTR